MTDLILKRRRSHAPVTLLAEAVDLVSRARANLVPGSAAGGREILTMLVPRGRGPALDLIDGFLARYMKEYDYYDQVARRAEQILDSNLHAAGIRSIVTSRAKSPIRLEEKCRQRHKKRPYGAIEDIYTDIVDLAGVRVALYFPAEREQVGGLISRLFYEYQPRRVFPEDSHGSSDMRFSGYMALHYRVRLRPDDMNESDQRYTSANIEIQVASVLMHAWAEVNHDLVYKPYEGELSEAEYSLLDQLNGLVHTGEISLEQLQKAGEVRVARGSRPFANHYELAAHLLSQASTVNEGPITESGLGRVDLLFELLTRLGLDTPDALRPYLGLLHGDIERRPLAEQIIDAMVAEDASRYGTYRSVRAEAAAPTMEQAPADIRDNEITDFITLWGKFERILVELLPTTDPQQPPRWTDRELERHQLFTPEIRSEIAQLRRIRNDVVHVKRLPPAEEIREARERLTALVVELASRPPSPSA